MSLSISSPPNISIKNSRAVAYITGNESTDGSIRFILNQGDDFVDIEKRENGIWLSSNLKMVERFVVDDNTGGNMIDSTGDQMLFI